MGLEAAKQRNEGKNCAQFELSRIRVLISVFLIRCFKDVDRDGYSVTIQGMDRMRERIYEAIDHGFVHIAGKVK